MSLRGRAVLALAAIIAAGAGGYLAGHRDVALLGPSLNSVEEWLRGTTTPAVPSGAAPSGPPLYYRHPDGLPLYSSVPKTADDGREFIAVYTDDKTPLAGLAINDTAPPDKQNGKRILYYRNPMGLPDVSPTPKKDPMGMDYIPVYEGEDTGDTSVKVSLGKLQRTGVRIEPVIERIITTAIRAPGTVQLDERNVAVVATRSDAFINQVANVTTGDRVQRGQPLLHVYSPDIAAASAQLLTAAIGSERVGGASGARQRLENLGVSPEDIDAIEKTRKVPPSIIWRAPRAGTVLQRNAVEGMKAAPGDVLFRIADTSEMWVVADIPEYDQSRVRIGAKATIRLRSQPDRTFLGEVALIYPEVSMDIRTLKVRIEFSNPDGILLPGMYANVEIGNESSKRVVAVPDSAVIDTGDQQIVFVDKGEGRLEPRAVKLGAQGGGFTEISSGLSVGERVVTAATFLIDAESNLQSALSSMTPPEATK